MSPRLPTHGSTAGPARSWRPFGVPKRVLAAAATVLVGACALLALRLVAAADADERSAPPAARIEAAAASDVSALAPLPAGSRPFAAGLGLMVHPRLDGHLPARAIVVPAPAPAGLDEPAPAPGGNVWDRVADCESGDWDRHGVPVHGTARWDLRPGAHIFEGGLQFHPDTWDGFAPGVLDVAPAAAYEASRAEQIAVAEAVLDAQGWEAWPVCSRKLGLRA